MQLICLGRRERQFLCNTVSSWSVAGDNSVALSTHKFTLGAAFEHAKILHLSRISHDGLPEYLWLLVFWRTLCAN